MNRLIVSLLIIFGAFAGLLIWQASKTGTSLVITPSELFAKGSDVVLQRIRVAGRVSAEPIDYQIEPLAVLKFSVENPGVGGGAVIPVIYRGIKPDMFASGRDVIIDGEFSGGVLTASQLMTQCPSKYEAPSPESQYGVSLR